MRHVWTRPYAPGSVTLQLTKHLLRFVRTFRLPQYRAIQIDERISADNQRVGMVFGHGASLAMGIELGHFHGGQRITFRLGRIPWHDSK